MTQPDSNLLALARTGDIQAITTFINSRMEAKGITTKVSIKDDCLKLLLESQDVPQQPSVTSFARNLLTNLRVSGIHRVKLYGRKKGDELPAWDTEFELVEKTPVAPNSFSLSSSIPQTTEQQKISKSKAYEYGIAGAVLGLIISLPSVWAALQMLQIAGGGSFSIGYIIGIGVVVFFGYLSGFSQGLAQFAVNCPSCSHNFILPTSGANCPACNTGLYIDERGDCQMKL